MKKRIWELDVLRGICLLIMVIVHFGYDITVLFPLVSWQTPQFYSWLVPLTGSVFVLISGICVTLGKHPVRRGLTVLAGGMVCTAVTGALYLTGFCDGSIVIYFGVLHCLGCCMLLWPVFRRYPHWLLPVFGIGFILLGRYFAGIQGRWLWLIPFGVATPEFASSDYFPLVRHLGTFLCGAVAGRYLYASRTSLFPKMSGSFFLLRFFGWCGRKSLWIYLLHQPVLAALAAVLYIALV